MPDSQAIRNARPKSGATCARCGTDIPDGRESIHFDGELWLARERLDVESYVAVASAATEILEAAVKAALNLGHVGPDGVLLTVARVVREQTSNPIDTIEALTRGLETNEPRRREAA